MTNKFSMIVILACLCLFACEKRGAETIRWQDGKAAWQYTSYSNSVWEMAGQTCPSGYDELRSICDEDSVCTIVFRCHDK